MSDEGKRQVSNNRMGSNTTTIFYRAESTSIRILLQSKYTHKLYTLMIFRRSVEWILTAVIECYLL